ncbi:uncharacterized protein LOC114244718 [Bombyx mandarina]|uniref:Protein sleepless n=2 Tax=Bombyx TaxID=7090 RepID=A0A8R2AGS6_BOMMO|nr:uncharacterized protein LOC101738841 isoform X1 [Bombyx mori]XP_028032404.1 uncharacterized protein LOC114244718 [Bombyx mandarina]
MDKKVYYTSLKSLQHIVLLLMFCCIKTSVSLLCYNCSATQNEWNGCGGDFVHSVLLFNSTRHFLVNCSEENAMCFVRSWMARAHNSWLVQRGCYLPSKNDALPHSMSLPTRAMTCKHERLADAEYKVCLCKADWCNSGNSVNPYQLELVLSVSLLYYQI